MAGKTTLFNTESTPAVYTDDGRSVDGISRVQVDSPDATAQHLLDTGVLIEEKPETAKKTGSKDSSGASAPDKG